LLLGAGLAEEVGFGFLEQNQLERADNPTKAFLQEWGNRFDLSYPPTLGSLVDCLAILGREDVLTDCTQAMRKYSLSVSIHRISVID
jgi:hypothetical protein